MSAGTIGLAFLAGILTVLSPCVLPLLPITLGAAAASHRLGPIALALGLALSFTLVGLFVAVAGFALGLDAELFRMISAVMLLAIGIVLLVPPLQDRLAAAAGPLSNWFNARFGGPAAPGLAGQFGVGVLLGAIWSPCVGPTLGAASILASQGKDLPQVALTMLAFGLGAGLPLVLLGLASRRLFQKWRGALGTAGAGLKKVLGALLVGVGLMILTGFDKTLETWLVRISPDWLNTLTTRF